MKICIADRQSRVRFGLRVFLEQQPGWVISGEFASGPELLERVDHDCPDLVLLDCELPGLPVEKILSLLRQTCPGLRVIVLGGSHDLRQSALQAGADAFASKMEPPEKILVLIREISISERNEP
jgi:DNA-binding NarL/FixJ family response regulator